MGTQFEFVEIQNQPGMSWEIIEQQASKALLYKLHHI